MLDPELAADLLRAALSTGGRFAEVFAEQRTSTSIRLDDGRIEEVTAGSDRGAGIRVFHGESQAYAFSNRLDPQALREAALAAASAVRGGEPGGHVLDLRRTEPITHALAKPPDLVPTDQKVGWVRQADDAARSFDSSVRQVLAGYGDSTQRVLIANSEGVWTEEERPRVRLVVQVVAARDGVVQTGFDGPAGPGRPGGSFPGRSGDPPAHGGYTSTRTRHAATARTPTPAATSPQRSQPPPASGV